MQFLRNQLPDFENSRSCLILTLLLIEQCTMYPPHLNYTTTLPCKTLSMKITIFTGGFFLSAREIREGLFLLMKTTFPVKHQNDRVWSAGTKKCC